MVAIPVTSGGSRAALRLLFPEKETANGNSKTKKSRQSKYQESRASGQAQANDRALAEIGSHRPR
jgi:hypothetical protein